MPDSDAETAAAVALEECSLEDLVSALLSARPVSRGVNADPFILADDNSRKIFAYYVRNRDLWPRAKPVSGQEIQNILDALEADLPERAEAPATEMPSPQIWSLQRIEAHRFGGLHRHCGPQGQDPDLFTLEIARDITLISGFNGAGKTALLSAVIWCLTGKALRSHRLPDEIHDAIPVARMIAGQDEGEEGQGPSEYSVPPITPIPSGKDLDALHDQPKIDTWVRLTFKSLATGEIRTVVRKLEQRPNGRIDMVDEGFDDLSVPTMALEVGTLMPGIAAHMRFDEKTVFPSAIAQLTGLKPLEDLGKRTERIVSRLNGDETRKTETARAGALEQFHNQKQTFMESWQTQNDLGPSPAVLEPGETAGDLDCAGSIIAIRSQLESVQSALEAAVDSILGHRIELADKADVDAFLNRLGEAADALKSGALVAIPAIALAKSLGDLSGREMANADALIAGIIARATALAHHLEDEKKAARWQLYSRVAAWHQAHHADIDISGCPVCGTNLDTVPADALLDLSVKEALERCRKADADIAKTAAEWESDEARAILDGLPQALRPIADKLLPETLLELYRSGFVDQLMGQNAFDGRLEPLRGNAPAVWEIAIEENPLPEPPALVEDQIPEIFAAGTLAKRIKNIRRAVQFAVHRQDSGDALQKVVQRYVGSGAVAEAGEAPEASPQQAPLRHQVEFIRRSVQSAEPIVSLKRQLDDLDRTRQAWETQQKRFEAIGLAATAMQPFLLFSDLVYEQVTGLIATLHEGINGWLDKLYKPHYRNGPEYSAFDPADELGVGLRAAVGDMQLSAHHVMNSSLLRACVWAFMFSLWEHVLARGRGLNCILLDDPQTHFDPKNCDNLASTVPEMVGCGMRPIITSNDLRFLASVRDVLPRKLTVPPTWMAFDICPVSSSKLTASIAPAVEDLRDRRERWKEDDNNPLAAQEYVERVRQHIENRLWNLLATDPLVLHKPTLADLLNRLKGARGRGEHPFEEPPFARLLDHPALRDDANFYTIINNAHHRIHEITPHDAGEVDKVFDELDNLLRSCAASYARFMGRLTREDSELYLVERPEAPQPIEFDRTTLPLLGRLAARSGVDILANPEEIESFDVSQLGPVALYAIRAHNLGTLALRGQIVLAAMEQDAADGDPVIAHYGDKIYARRLGRPTGDRSRITLFPDRSGTESVPPVEILSTAKTRLFPIVGVLYDAVNAPGSDEACLVDGSALLSRPLETAQAVDDSAYPVIRNGDTVLLERIDPITHEAVEQLEGHMVAVVASAGGESFGYLKRFGPEVQMNVRLLENIGLHGSAACISMSEGDDDQPMPDYPVIQRLWHVHGVIRTGGAA